MARDYDFEIARHILAAQYYSDIAKIYDRGYYQDKDFHIKEALNKIIRSKTKNFRFSVVDGGSTPYLVYFKIKTPEGSYQVSFHSFSDGLWRYYKSSQKTYWDKKVSREAAVIAAYYYGVVDKDEMKASLEYNTLENIF